MKFAVIPTTLTRPCLAECVAAIKPQVDEIILIDSCIDVEASPAYEGLIPTLSRIDHHIVSPGGSQFNLSRAWNLGLEAAATRAFNTSQREWWVAIINDDAIVPPHWMEQVVKSMRDFDMVMGASGSPSGHNILNYPHSKRPVPVHERLPGWAFVLRGKADIWCDEEFVWWFGDDDLSWRAAEAGGTIRIPGFPVRNLFENGSMTAELQVQAGKDAEHFVAKHGTRPW